MLGCKTSNESMEEEWELLIYEGDPPSFDGPPPFWALATWWGPKVSG